MQTDNASAVVTVTQEDYAIAQGWAFLLEHRYSEYEGDAVNELAEEIARHRLASQSESTARVEAMREQGQAEGFAAAVAQLRALSAQNPPATLHHAASLLADSLEESRQPARAALHVEGAGS
jgi:hypothetical protein